MTTEPPVTSADRQAVLPARPANDAPLAPREPSKVGAAGWANWQRLTREAAGAQPEARPWLTATELESKTFTEPKFAVPGLVPHGLSILAGRPKIGKSWLALALADSVSRGALALGNIATERGPVLYLGLEDNLRRRPQRLRAGRQGARAGVDLALACNWPRFDSDGLNKLECELARIAWRLVVVDTFAKVRPEQDSRASIYDRDYAALSEVKALADRYGTAILLLHH